MNNELLERIGLNAKEAEVYLAVLKKGKATPTSIAQSTKINRTTIYSVAKELVKKGFLSEDLAGGSSFVATNPSELKFLIQKEEKALEEKKGTINQAIAELQNLSKSFAYQVPKITFIQEDDLEDYLYRRSDEWHRSIMERDGILWGFQDHTFAENYEKWIDWEWQVGGPKDLQLKLLSNDSDIEKKNTAKGYSRRQIKSWKNGTGFTATVWVHGDYVLMVYTKSRPHYLIEIYDIVLADNMRKLFAGIWNEIS